MVLCLLEVIIKLPFFKDNFGGDIDVCQCGSTLMLLVGHRKVSACKKTLLQQSPEIFI